MYLGCLGDTVDSGFESLSRGLRMFSLWDRPGAPVPSTCIMSGHSGPGFLLMFLPESFLTTVNPRLAQKFCCFRGPSVLDCMKMLCDDDDNCKKCYFIYKLDLISSSRVCVCRPVNSPSFSLDVQPQRFSLLRISGG